MRWLNLQSALHGRLYMHLQQIFKAPMFFLCFYIFFFKSGHVTSMTISDHQSPSMLVSEFQSFRVPAGPRLKCHDSSQVCAGLGANFQNTACVHSMASDDSSQINCRDCRRGAASSPCSWRPGNVCGHPLREPMDQMERITGSTKSSEHTYDYICTRSLARHIATCNTLIINHFKPF